MKRVSISETALPSGEESSIADEFFNSGGGFSEIRTLKKAKFKRIAPNSSAAADNGRLKSALKKPKTPGLGIGGSVHLPPLHVEDVNGISDIVHRVTLQSGIEPGAHRLIQTPSHPLDKAVHMGELQFKSMMESIAIKEVLHEVLEVHTEINNFAQSLGHRQQAARRLEEANKLNLKLFQRMISEVLMLHRQKFQSQTSQCSVLEEQVLQLQQQLLSCQDELEIGRSRIKKLDIKCSEFELLCRAKDAELAVAANQLAELQTYQEEYLSQLEAERRFHATEQEELRSRFGKALDEERSLLNSQRHEMMLQLMRENELHHQSMLLRDEKRNRSKKPSEPAEPQAAPRVITSTTGTQTEVDDFGLWHKQDGWIFPITGTIVARNHWKRAGRFAGCPSCKGVGRYMTRAATLFHKFQRGELENDRKMKEFRTSGKWVLPDELVQFMSNLPKTIEASRVWSLSKCVRFWWSILSLKMESDAEDDRYGYGIQGISEFIIETFLLRTENRSEAELLLYHLVRSVRDHVIVKRNPFLHTFARFLGALDGPLLNEDCIFEEAEGGEEKESEGIKRSKGTAAGGLLNQKGLIRVTSTTLPTSILTVYMFARNCFLLPYRGEYAQAIATAKGNSELMQRNHRLLQEDPLAEEPTAASDSTEEATAAQEETEGSASSTRAPASSTAAHVPSAAGCWSIQIPDHVCVLEKLQMWIPLDRAVFVTRAVLHFLSEKHMTIILKHLESMAMFLSSQGVLEEPDGNHTVIRAVMRRLQDMTTESRGGPSSNSSVTDNNVKTIVVNMDKLLQAIVELLLGRVKSLEDRLKKQFAQGDDNGDGVLSFQEFLQMMTAMAPHFPKRRILRMFREALMRGKDDAHIDQQSFVEVCKQHGLAQLVDINSLKKTVLAELYPLRKEPKGTAIDRLAKENSSKRSPLTLAEVTIATNALRRVLGRQPSQSRSQAMEEAGGEDREQQHEPGLRRTLSEEVQTSSKEATEQILNALVAPDIRKTLSEDLFALQNSAQILEEIKTNASLQQQSQQQGQSRAKGQGQGQGKNQQRRLEKGTSVPSIALPELLPPRNESQIPSTSRKTTVSVSNSLKTARKPNLISDDDDDEDGHVVPLSSIRKSASQTPRITPQITPKQTPRYTPRVYRGGLGVGSHQLLNSAAILSLSENDESLSLVESSDSAQITAADLTVTVPGAASSHGRSHVSSQILFGDEEEDGDLPDLSDI